MRPPTQPLEERNVVNILMYIYLYGWVNKLYKNVPGVPPPRMHLLEPCTVRKNSLHFDPRWEFRFICWPSPGLVGLDGALHGPALPSLDPVKTKLPNTSVLVMK